MKRLVEAEVFDDFLEQAQQLLSRRYFQAAAVIAGCVLEEGLRKLCIREGIPIEGKKKFDWMNSELAKKGIYDSYIKNKMSSLYGLRSNAAHARWKDSLSLHVEDMLAQVKSLKEEYFT